MRESGKSKKGHWQRIVFGLAFFSLLGGLFISPAEAVQVKMVQSGTLTFDNDDTIITADLTYPVSDQSKSIILVTNRSVSLSNDRDQNHLFTGEFEDNGTIIIERAGATQYARVTWYVIEFVDGVRVVRGRTTMKDTVTTKNIDLPPPVFDTGKSFILLQLRAPYGNQTYTENLFGTAMFVDSDTIQINRGVRSVNTAQTYVYQVVEFQTDATVQSGEVTMNYNLNSTTTNLTTAISDFNKAFLITQFRGDSNALDGTEAHILVRGNIDETDVNKKRLYFRREGTSTSTSDTLTIRYYLVELSDPASLVQKNIAATPATLPSIAITSVPQQLTVVLDTTIDTTRSIPIRTVSGGTGSGTAGGTSYDDFYDDDSVTFELSSTQFLLKRFSASGATEPATVSSFTPPAANIDWFVVEFCPLTLKTPNGGEVWRVGESQNITWKHASQLESGGTGPGGAHAVKLELSTSGGSSYPLVIANGLSAAADSYVWTIPDSISGTNLIGTQLKVKITDTDLSTRNYDTSNTNFEIKGTITVTAPNDGEVWYVGDTARNITWNKTGDLSYSTFSIRLSEDGGASYNTVIADNLAQGTCCTGNSCSYNWNPIPDKIGNDRRIRVYLAADSADVKDESDANFYIKGSLDITSPNGGQTWGAQTTQTITWDKTGTFSTVSLYYSTNSGGSYPNTITTGQPAGSTSGSYNWTVPTSAISDYVRVKVVSDQAADLQVEDASDADFSIVPSIKVTSPDSGTEVWRVGETKNITWTTYGSINNVKIEYSTDGGSTWVVPAIADSIPAASGSYPWTIPDAIGSQVKVRVSNADNPNMFDTSDNNFNIKGKLVVTDPNGGETLTVNSSFVITWEKYGSIGNINIKYSTDGGATYPNTIATVPASNLNYTWNSIPDSITDTAKIRIELISDPSGVLDDSDINFYIRGSLTITSPNNGTEEWPAGSSQNITWIKQGTLGNVELRYSKDGGITFPDTNVIVSGIAADSSPYLWTIPDDAIGNSIRVRVHLISDPTVSDMSDTNFAIKGNVNLTAPVGGEVWEVGTDHNITWTKNGTFNIKLEYSKDGGNTYPYLIATDIPVAQLSYTWTIPDAIDNDIRVKITSLSDPTTNDTSTEDFTIRGRFIISLPNGGETWYVGTQNNIQWTTYGTIDKVNLYYSTDNGATYPSTIVTALSNVDGYLWTIPDAIDTDIRVKVESFYDANTYDTSNTEFTIKGSVTLTSPNMAETWIVNESRPITWTKQGSIGNVKLEYSTNAGATYPYLIAASVPSSDLNYPWTVPDSIGINTKVKITPLDSTKSDPDESDAVFTIKGSITLVTPNGGENWLIGSSQNITWTRNGSIGNIKIEYSTDGGASYPNTITSSTDSSTLSYTWNPIPDTATTQAKIKLTSIADDTVTATSSANFRIKGALNLTAPNGGENWIVGTVENITWEMIGTLASVTLEYSTDGGATYPNLIATTSGTALSYAWTIPDSIDSDIRIRIRDTNDATVYDTSFTNFSIKGLLDLTAPDGGETWIVGTGYDITWTRQGSILNAKLEYSTDGGSTYPNTIVASTPAGNLSYNWTIPDNISDTCKVKITNVDDTEVFATSTNNFRIKGSLTITSPNGGENWAVNTVHAITWNKTGTLGDAKLEYSTDGGTSYPNTIIASIPAGNLSYNWTIPDNISNQVKVKITLLSDSTVYDASNNNFSIKGGLTLTAPNGGETWIVGENRNITWTRQGSIANVKLEYSTDGGSTYPNLIAASVSGAALSYSWTIPDSIDNDILVKITDTSDAEVYDTSDNNFSIKGSLDLISPNGGESWIVDSSYLITWTKTGTIPNAKLEYSTDKGATYPNVIINSTPAEDLSYTWNIPDDISNTCRVRISNVDDSTVKDESATNFKIKGALTLISPNGNEGWPINSQQNITWTKTGTLGDVKLEYSTDGGASYPNVIVASIPASNLSYTWTVADSPSSQAKVKITLLSDSTVTDASNNNFSIKGSLYLTAPDGGETWIVGDTKQITWTKFGAIATVKLEYSTDSGLTYPNVIATGVSAGVLSYNWVIPDSIGTQLKVKITDEGDGTVFANSSADFTIKGSVTLTSPNGGETWIVGENRNITWNKTGSIGNVKLEYSTDGGTSYPNVIVASVPSGDLSYPWTVTDAISNTVKIKITALTDTSVSDTSDGNFTIKGRLTLTSPNGGETWIVGESRNITWSRTGSIASVKLEYSTDGGTSYPNIIIASTNATTGTYAWTIPDAIDTDIRVRVSDVSDASVYDTSDSNFTIKGSLTLTSPNGGEAWVVNSQHNITWTKTGTISTVKLEYSTDGGSTYPNIITSSVEGAALSYAWTIPDNISSQIRVKVTNNSDSTVNDASDANFKIIGSFTLTSPNGAEKWTVGNNYNITWTRTGSIANAKLEYSADGGSTYPNLIIASTSAAALSYSWTIPDAIDNDIKVKISDASDASVYDASDANFAIIGGFTITSPNGGEVWIVGQSQNITWNTAGTVANVKLEYSTDGGSTYPNLIIASAVNTGTYAWTIPDSISASVRVKVSDVTNSDAFDTSNANFKIQGGLVLNSPNGGETWIVGESRNITWSRTGSIANVKLEYSTDGGSTYPNVIIASTDASGGSYAWQVADAIDTDIRVKVSDTADATVNDTSDGNFTIKGSLTLTSPNGGESWVVNSQQNITWTKTGSIATVKLEYSTDGGGTYPNVIALSVDASTGTPYAWTIPDTISSSARIKVTNNVDSTVFDASDSNFKITGSFTLTSPNGNEKWTVGTNQTITWTRIGSIANAKLEYSTDGGSTYPNLIIASTPAADLTYSWTIPDSIDTDIKVRISDVSDSTVFDASDNNFAILAGFTIIGPNGGEVWTVGSVQDITWTTGGTVGNVKLEYSTDGGSTYPNIIIASVTNTGTYSWTIPDSISTQIRVKVSDVNNADAFDTSNANFKIRAGLTLATPNGGEDWLYNTQQNIAWTKTGTISTVKLEYSTDSGSTYPNVIATLVNATTGTPYAWTIPDNLSTNCRVKITNEADSTVFDTSNADFTIKGSLTLNAPNGAENWIVADTQNITWTRSGSIANIKLEYSTNGGTTYPNLIIASTPASTGSYPWTIPDAIGTQLRVRITDLANTNVLDTSDADFTIKGSVTLTSPNGGETWVVGASQNITWTRTGSFANVKLEYSTNGFSDELQTAVITNSTPAADLAYAWTVPDAIGTSLKVRISDVNDATVVDTSDTNFTIKGSLTLTSPNGGETWIVGESRNITWSRTGSIASVKLEYSTDGGTSYPNIIIASTNATTGTYAWTIPDAIDTDIRVRVSDVSDASVYDTSDSNFTIKGSLTLTSPNGGEAWVVNSQHNITWTKTGTISTVKLEYSTDGFSDELQTVTIASSVPGSDLSYTWTIPDALSQTVKVRVTNNADTTVKDVSDTSFKIVGSFTLVTPNGAEQWTVNTQQNITWARVGTIINAKLEYSTDGGSTYPNIIVASTPAGGLVYTWTIPDSVSTTCKVKISDASDASVYDASDANFAIRGGFTITSPNGGEVWIVGTAQNITWTTTGSVANIKLEYSTNGGTSYPNLIIASTPNAGTYGWTIPDSICTTARVKVSDVNNSQAFDISDNNFKIRGAFTISAPNGGEQWIVGTNENITWNTTGTIDNVKLEYSANGFSDELQTVVIVASAVNNNYYTWVIPDAISNTVKVRITNVADSTVYDLSNANFIIKGSVTLTAPNGGEIWIVGESRNITWTKTGSIATVKLEYSTDGGSTYPNLITASTPAGDLSYAWTIPDAISATLKVRITDTTNSTVTDTSDSNFEIKGSLIITTPNGGEVWRVGENRNVTWDRIGSIANVKLEYSTDGGVTYPNVIVTSTDASTGSYAWTIPDAIGTQLRVKITNVSDSAVSDTSNSDFEIKGSLTITSPNGGEIWIVGSTQSITWTRSGSIANVKLEYSSDGGVSFPNLIIDSTSAAAGSYNWAIPDAISTTIRVKITNVDDSAVYDTSDTNFKIAGSLTLTTPNGGESWVIASSQSITWARTGSIASVKLEYSTDGGATYPNVIAASADASAGSYAWTVSDTPSPTCRVKITNIADTSVFDTSDANFRIRGAFTLTSPNGGDVWIVSESRNITWLRQGSIANAKLEYSTDGGANYPNVITASTPAGDLTYPWTVPDAIGAQLRVKISDVNDATVFDTSDSDFEIKGSLILTSPNGAEVWIVGESRNITWTKTGSIANVKLEYSTDGGVSYPNVIVASTDATTGIYSWTVADAIGTTLKVKITNVLDGAVYDTSNSNFTIKGSLTLISPNGGEAWAVGSSQNISWSRTGSIANVELRYSTDGGASYPNIIVSSTPAGDLNYVWTIPDVIGNQVMVKITDVMDSTVADVSNANFKITGSFTLTTPNGGEVWIVGENRNIIWTKTGSIANAKLEYSTDGGVSYPNLITSSVPANLLSYTWTLPDNITSTVKVKISDASDSTVFDTSDANFKIAGSFTITAPNGGEKWPIGSAQAITWTKTGSIANAKLEYSTDGGTSYPYVIIATTPAANLSYAWTIPDNPSLTCRVKISDVSDSTVFDTSNADFKIHGSFTITAPNGGEVWQVGEVRNITWTTNGSIANVKLEYSINGGSTYPNLIVASTTNSGSYSWTIPDAIGTTLRVKITDVLDADATDTSNANFKIRGVITVTAPNGGEAWIVESVQNITWSIIGSIANVKLEYSTDGGASYPPGNLIAASVNASLGTYAWTIPDAIGTNTKLKITDTTDATVYDESNTAFTIRGGFTLTTPNGGEKWTVGTSQNITWSTFGTIPNVKLEYSTDGGSTYPNIIVTSTANTGSYAWSIPNSISSTCRVRVSNAADAGSFDVSDANFKIMGGFTIISPDGSETWTVNESRDITWTTYGTVANVKLEYSTDGGETYPYTITTSIPNTNSYNWTVADAISATVRLRISDATDSDAFDTSNGNFKIKAGFNLNSPNGGEAWAVASVRNITWTTFGTVSSVKLEYSTDGGVSYPNVIIGSTTNTGTYAWTIPDAITTAARVRVSDVNDSTSSDASNANFKIQGGLTIIVPNGGEKWIIGNNYNITWDRVGSIPFVKLEYSTDGGTIYAPIVASTSNTGSYSWAIPDTASTTVKVRITDTNDPTVVDVSDNSFKIQAGFTLTSPNGGEVWLVGSAQTITWNTQGTVSFVRLDYSTDGGLTYPNEITTSTNNTGSYAWTVPDSISGTVRVKITHTNDPDAFDASNANFRIRAIFSLVSPNGGQQWLVGNNYNITWTTTGTIPNVKLQYSRDGFATDIQTISASTPNTGTYVWTIPDTISNTLRVRVSDPNDIGAYDDSNADFRITARFTVTSPNGGEKWDVASNYNITWTWSGAVSNAKIEYSTNGGATYPYVITQTDNDGSYAWTIPDTISAECRVKISDPADPTAYDISDANFKIKAPFTLISPNGGEIWIVGENRNISWTWTGTVPNVKLDYSLNDFATFGSIIASTPNTGSYVWTIPDAISTTVKARVMSTTDSDAYDISDNNFKIRGAFTITSPNGGELWLINQVNNITWNTIGTIPTIRLLYSTDSGSTYPNVIVDSTNNTGSYAWLLPDVPTINARVRIVNTADSTVYDDSNANFRIRGYFTLTAPNGGEAWIVGSQHNIAWNWGGTIPNVKLSYSKDSGATFNNLINVSAPNGSGGGGSYTYAWTIPDDISLSVRVKIEDPNDDTVYDTSDSDFKIRGDFVLTAPNGGERWVTNEIRTITWTSTGTMANVKLEYSKDNFVSNINTIIASTPNNNSYNWTIPDDRSATVRLRVSDVNDATVYDVSDNDFKIDYYTITWTLRDLLTNEPLTNLSTREVIFGTDTVNWQAAGLTSPISHDTPYGFWTTTWSCPGYGDKAQNFEANSDQSFTLFMETTAIHIWRAYSEFAYIATEDKLEVSSWLERDGFVVTGAVAVQVDIYDMGTLIKTLTSTSPTSAGFFNISWTSTGLQAGKVYTTVTDITNASGAHFKTPGSFEITESKRLEEMQATVNSVLDKPISEVSAELQSSIQNQTNLIDQKMTEQVTIIQNSMDEMETTINNAMTSFETSVQESLATLQEGAQRAVEAGTTLEATAKKFSWKASVSPDPALTGDMITLSCQGQPGLFPMLDIYSWDNKAIINDVILQDTTGEGLYTYEFKADGRFAPGKAYTFVITEQTTGGMVSGSGMVESMGITSVAGLAAAAPEAERAAKKALDAIKAVEAVLISGENINIALTLKNLKESVDTLPEVMAKEGPSVRLTNVVNEISERIRTLAGEEGYDLSTLLEEALTESPTIKDMRSKTEAINSVIDLLLQIFEAKFGGVDTPVISTSLQPGSVKFRIVAVNPSKSKTQKIQAKSYLPEEVKPKDVLELGGLELEYDAEKSIYYVYKPELELAPGEVRVFEVEVEDVWIIPEKDLNELRSRTESILNKLLEKPEYYAKAKEIADTIYPRLEEIATSQADESVSRQRHIGIYRQNILTIEQIKEDIARMEKILVTAGGPPAPEMLTGTKIKADEPTKTMTWIVIFAIIIFVGLLAFVFFFTWHRQMRIAKEELTAAKKSAFPESAPNEQEPKEGQ